MKQNPGGNSPRECGPVARMSEATSGTTAPAYRFAHAGNETEPQSLLSCPAKAGHPVRRGFSVQAAPSLEYWIE
jgi:hypothetical protein